MELTAQEWVTLNSPLPASLAGVKAELTGLSYGMLKLRIPGDHRLVEKQLTDLQPLSVDIYDSDRTYHFKGVTQGDRLRTEVLLRVSQHEQALLEELQGQVRKNQHIDLCMNGDVESSDRDNGLKQIRLMPRAIPELNWDDIDPSVNFLGRKFAWPVLITGMTGGVRRGTDINRCLARIAAKYQIPLGVGSQRIALEQSDYADIFRVKHLEPDVFLLGNIGASQLLTAEDPVRYCQRAVDMIAADALAIHLNVMQECIQAGGDRNFRGVIDVIHRVCSGLTVPVMVKEVGAGLDPASASQLLEAGVRALDTGGRGGTSWGYIEGLRAADQETRRLGTLFRDWGLSTGESLRRLLPIVKQSGTELVATGGIRHGLDVARACAAGATMAGIGLPFFRAALESEKAAEKEFLFISRGLKIAMLTTGSRRIQDLNAALIPDHG